MNLIEAIKSGRRFKRPGQEYRESLSEPPGSYFFSKQALLATDWELEPFPEKTVTISKKDLEKILRRIAIRGTYSQHTETIIKMELEELGLDDKAGE